MGVMSDNGENRTIIQILSATGDKQFLKDHNPEHVIFFSLSEENLKIGLFCDPWHNPYHIKIVDGTNSVIKIGTNIINDRIAIWSDGQNGVNEYGEGDDVCSWKNKRGCRLRILPP